MQSRAWAVLERVRAIQERAEGEERELTADEAAQVRGLIDRAREVDAFETRVGALQRDLDGPGYERSAMWPEGGVGLGDQFVASEGYKSIADPAARSQRWSTGAIELETKTTLTSTPGTALTPAGYAPGVVETLYQRPYLADLIPAQLAPGNPVRFVSETSATNAAAATSEAGAKPESTLTFGETSEPVRKIATFLPISDELLEDAPQIRAYLNQRLTLFVQQVEESQLLLGSGTAPNLQGFVASGRAIGTYARGTVDDNATALFKAANGTRGSSFLDPDTVVIHPTNWQAIRLGKDNSGQFYGGGPFYGPYGGPQGPAGASQFQTAESLWGMRVVVTSAITVGTALVGAFATGAALFRRGGLRVEATNSHGTFFQSDITAIRAELREALAVYRPSAFVAVTGLA